MKFKIDIDCGVPVLVREIALYFSNASENTKVPLSELSSAVARSISVLPCIVEEYLLLMSDHKILNFPFLQKEIDLSRREKCFFSLNSMQYFTARQMRGEVALLLLLTNGTVCFSKNKNNGILPHNLREICNAVIMLLDNPETSNDEISKVFHGPDLPSGGILVCEKDLYNKSFSKLINRANIQVYGNQLRVMELPYMVQAATVVEEIVSLSRSGKLDVLQDLYNNSSKEKTDILIEVKRETNIEKLFELLYRKTSLQRELFSERYIDTTEGEKMFTLKEMLQTFIHMQLNLGLNVDVIKDNVQAISEKYGRQRMTKIYWK